MPALNFTPHNAALVAQGRKPHTIRRQRKRPFRPGDRLIFYTGQRPPNCRALGSSRVAIALDCVIDPSLGQVILGGKTIPCHRVLDLALADGCSSVKEFFLFFGGQLSGQLVGWDTITLPSGETIPTNLWNLAHIQNTL